MSLNGAGGGWQAVALVALGVGAAVAGVWLPHGDALVALGSSIVGGVLGVLQPWRSPARRERASDRTPTAGLGVPILDPDQTPTQRPQLPPGVTEDRRRSPR